MGCIGNIRGEMFGQGHNEDGTTIHSGKDTKHESVVAFTLNYKAKKALLLYKPKNEIMISARLRSHPFNANIIQVYHTNVLLLLMHTSVCIDSRSK